MIAGIAGLVGALGGAIAGAVGAVRGARISATETGRALIEQAQHQAKSEYSHWLLQYRTASYESFVNSARESGVKLREVWRLVGNNDLQGVLQALTVESSAYMGMIQSSARVSVAGPHQVVIAAQKVVDLTAATKQLITTEVQSIGDSGSVTQGAEREWQKIMEERSLADKNFIREVQEVVQNPSV